MFDVVTTAIYSYAQYPGGPALEDRTLALKLLAGRHQSKAYPSTEQLLDFGRRVCGVSQPAQVIGGTAQPMDKTLEESRADARVPAALLAQIRAAWQHGMLHAK